MLVAAADPVGDPALVLRAAQILNISEDAPRQAEEEGFLTFGTEVSFRHPLVRSAVYRAFGSDEQAEIHRALADATDPAVDPDRRAWHLAQAPACPTTRSLPTWSVRQSGHESEGTCGGGGLPGAFQQY